MITWRRGLGAATTDFTALLTSAANQYNIPPSLLLAVAAAESGTPGQLGTGSATAVSSQGAQGLLQIMPANDASLGITNPLDPTQSAAGGAQLLSQYYQQFGNWSDALEAYNEGPAALQSQIAAGVTPTSAGYASSILSSAGISPDSSDTGDTSDSSPSDGSDPLAFLSVAGIPGTAVAIGAGLLLAILAVGLR
jgi:soluble lytic murein transglycosylase-like protein